MKRIYSSKLPKNLEVSQDASSKRVRTANTNQSTMRISKSNRNYKQSSSNDDYLKSEIDLPQPKFDNEYYNLNRQSGNYSNRYSPVVLDQKYNPLRFIGNSKLTPPTAFPEKPIVDPSPQITVRVIDKQSTLGQLNNMSVDQLETIQKSFLKQQILKPDDHTPPQKSYLFQQPSKAFNISQIYQYKRANQHSRANNHMFQAFANMRRSSDQDNLFQYQLRNRIYNCMKLQSYSQPQHLALKHLEKQKLKQSHIL